MSRALAIIDVQRDFTEGGVIAVEGGAAVARAITEFLAAHGGEYDHVISSQDWHTPGSDNGGHISEHPDWVDTWPPHCLAGSFGADFHPALDVSSIDVRLHKGMGTPGYSFWEGRDEKGRATPEILTELGVTDIDFTGIATDFCVAASMRDALAAGLTCRLLEPLCAGVAAGSTSARCAELEALGGVVVHEL